MILPFFALDLLLITGTEDNFVKLEENVTIDHLGTEYDYGSVMHYPDDAFAIDEDIPTIITKDPDTQDEIGQRVTMSEADIERVQILYSCVAPVSIHMSIVMNISKLCGISILNMHSVVITSAFPLPFCLYLSNED